MNRAEIAFGLIAGLTPIIAGWIGGRARTKMLERQRHNRTRSISVNHGVDASALVSKNDQHARRFKISGGRALVEWSDETTTDIAALVVRTLQRHGPSGGMTIR